MYTFISKIARRLVNPEPICYTKGIFASRGRPWLDVFSVLVNPFYINFSVLGICSKECAVRLFAKCVCCYLCHPLSETLVTVLL